MFRLFGQVISGTAALLGRHCFCKFTLKSCYATSTIKQRICLRTKLSTGKIANKYRQRFSTASCFLGAWHFSTSFSDLLSNTPPFILLEMMGLEQRGCSLTALYQGYSMYDNKLECTVSSSLTPYALTSFHKALWLYPVYSISFILNSIWYQEFADEGECNLSLS